MKENLQIFNRSVAEGPSYVWTCCHQLWFKHSVMNASSMVMNMPDIISLFEQCHTNFISIHDIECVCSTCKKSIYAGKIPKLSMYNGMGFPQRPQELELCPLKEHLVSPRIPFMQIQNLPCGSQKLVHGNIVNVPVDISPMINTLPHALSDSYTVAVRFKCKKKYKKKCAFQEEYVRPYAVWKAAEYVLQNSQLYKDLNIQINTAWLNEHVGNNSCLKHFVQYTNLSLDADEQSENVSSEEDTNNNIQAPDENSELVDLDTYSDSEVDSKILHAGAIEQHTLLENEDITIPASTEIIEESKEIIKCVPGKGQ